MRPQSSYKMSILVDTKMLLTKLLPEIEKMPKIERIEGAPVQMKKSAFEIIACFSSAYYCLHNRLVWIERMIGEYGKLLAAFEIAIIQGLFPKDSYLPIAECMEKIDTGIKKWYTYITSIKRLALKT